MSMPYRIAPIAFAICLCLPGLSACGDGGQTHAEAAFDGRRSTDIDLLVREPDSMAFHPGDITPTIKRDAAGQAIAMDWGDFRGPGWKSFAVGEDWGANGERAFIENNQPSAMLLLPAPARSKRNLDLTLWLAPEVEADEAPLEVSLNGLSLGTLLLGKEPAVHRFSTEGAQWREDKNRLELHPKQEPSGSRGGQEWDTIRLARVSYGPARSVQRDLKLGRLELAHSTGVSYYLESASAGTLILRGLAQGKGSLTLSGGSIDAQTGNQELADLSQAYTLEGAFQRALPLPRRPGALGFIKLIWDAASNASIEFNDLFVVEQETTKRPSIIFVSIDTLSARHMSVYGYERETTPQLAEFAKEAVLFERCAANAPWTLPSYLSVMTGLYPTSHLTQVSQGTGIQLSNNDYWQVALSRWTMAEALRARGYQTAAAVDTEWLAPTWRINQGFDLYDTSAFGPFDNPDLGIKLILKNYVTYLTGMRNESAPCFTFMHALDAHGPYWPEAPYADAFLEDLPAEQLLTPAGAMPQSYGAIPTWMAQTLTPSDQRARAGAWPIPSEQDLHRIVAMYDETILKVDDQLGKMFELLRSQGLYDSSVIVISGDHGESFKHDFYSHGCMWEDILHVPLLIKLPKAEFGGKRIEQAVQLVDLFPTLLELAGANPSREYLHGRSLVPLMVGETSPTRPTFSEGGHVVQYMLEHEGIKLIESFPGKNAADPALLTHPRIPPDWFAKNFPSLAQAGMLTQAVRDELVKTKGFDAKVRELQKLIEGPFYELYDLRQDPGELRDLSAQRPKEVARLLELLEREKQKGQRARMDASADIRIPLDAAQKDALDNLGYGEELDDDELDDKEQEDDC